MVITRHVDFLATASTSHREKDHVTRNDHLVPRRTTDKTSSALRPPSPSGKSISPPLRAGSWKISLRKKSQPPKCERTNCVSSPDLIAPPYRSPSTGVYSPNIADADNSQGMPKKGKLLGAAGAHGRGKARHAPEHACGRAQRRFLVLCAQFPACMPAFRAVRR